MPRSIAILTRFLALAVLVAGASVHAASPSRHLAPGFTARAADSRLLVLPADIELYSISAGGVVEPRDDWTLAAQAHFAEGLAAQRKRLGTHVTELTPGQADEFAEIVALHRAVADAISMHHRALELPTKDGKLDWSLGEAVRPLKERTGADYALFTWIRDSYASTERKAAMLAMALIGGVMVGGEQVGYASLVDLNTGRVVWFNDLQRMRGDLREAKPARETVEALLKEFPELK
ncbi:MAG: hypothetical protein ACO1OY_01915 [Ramlibacter sp.]|jgi:hypothetical protein